MALDQSGAAVYQLYDSEDHLLYVGVSNNPMYRLGQHSREKEWWSEVENQKIEWFSTRDVALRVEKETIKDLRPKYNIFHNGDGVIDKHLAVWVDQETHRRFRVLAAQNGLSMSKLLERLVDAELAKERDE